MDFGLILAIYIAVGFFIGAFANIFVARKYRNGGDPKDTKIKHGWSLIITTMFIWFFVVMGYLVAEAIGEDFVEDNKE